MQSAYFPLFIDISDKNILIVGGGHIAARRVKTLLKFTKRLTIVSPQLGEELSAYIKTPENPEKPKGMEGSEHAEKSEYAEKSECTEASESARKSDCAEYADRISWIPREYSPDCLAGMEIVLAATDCRKVNRQVVKDCRILEHKEQRRILVNTADDKTQCDFYFPSVVQSEEITIGINSGGQNPQKVKEVRQNVQKMLKIL